MLCIWAARMTRAIWSRERCISLCSSPNTFLHFYFNVSQSPYIHIICWIYPLDINQAFSPIHSDLFYKALSPKPESRNHSQFLLLLFTLSQLLSNLKSIFKIPSEYLYSSPTLNLQCNQFQFFSLTL